MAAEKKDNPKAQTTTGKADENVQQVKVTPYPIDCQLLKAEGQPPIQCQIVRVEEIGMIFKAIKHFFRPGEEYKCDFELPVIKAKVASTIKIIKTYEHIEPYVPTGTKERVMTVEAHFKALPIEVKLSIQKFVLKIGQKKL